MLLLFACLVIAVLIAVNAVYVAAEFAAVSVRPSRVSQLADEGRRTAKGLLPILEDGARLDRYIATCQIGITVSSLVLGAFAEATLLREVAPLLERWARMRPAEAASAGAVLILLAITVLQMVLGELVPKSLALQYPTRTALLTYPPLRWSMSLFTWFIAVLNGSAAVILRACGLPPHGRRHVHSPEQIGMLIAQSREGGQLDQAEHDRLDRALKLASRPAAMLMVPRPRIVAVDVDTPPDEVLRIVMASPYTRLPVYRGSVDDLIGMLHTKDVVRAYLEHGTLRGIESLLRPLPAVPEVVSAERVLSILRQKRSHQAMVVDEFGGVAGLITMDDVLSEILGDVRQAGQDVESAPERLPDGTVRLPGAMRLDEAAPWLGKEWHGTSHTVGGRILEELKEMPTIGKRLAVDGVDVEIESVEGRAVGSVLVRPFAEPPGGIHA